jgi:hypothetical protein
MAFIGFDKSCKKFLTNPILTLSKCTITMKTNIVKLIITLGDRIGSIASLRFALL